MTTLQDVANRAGVALMTASRALNNSGYVSPGVRERVLIAASELGYRPNSLARGLRLRRTQTLALVLTDITNPFFTTVARGVEDAASEAGYAVLFSNTDEDPARQARSIDLLLQKQVDGLLLVPAATLPDASREVPLSAAAGVPVVLLDRHIPHAGADSVRCDSFQGARDLTRLLLAHGHRRIALLNGPQGVSTSLEREAGYLEALREAGCADSARVLRGAFTQPSGAELVRQALQLNPRPTALLAANNFIAIGALNALRELGVAVPEDMALAGFDDLPPALVTFPFLTVAAQPAYEMGRRAAVLLIDRIEGRLSGPPQEIVLPTALIERASSGGFRPDLT